MKMTSTIWEEAENEFYSEAFLRDKNNSTLDSNQSTFDRTASIDTVIHRPNAGLDSVVSLRGRRKGTRSRSERMRAAIQGLGSEDSDGGGDYYGDGDYDRNGGSNLFLSENVITPLESWRNILKLKEAHLSLKCKKKIKKQCQKQPVLKQDHFSILAWKGQVLLWNTKMQWKKLVNFFLGLIYPSRHIERSKGRAYYNNIFLHKKLVLIGVLMNLVSILPNVFDVRNCDIIHDLDNDAKALKTRSLKNISFEESMLMDKNNWMFMPMKRLDEWTNQYRIFIPRPNLLAYLFCVAVVCLFYFGSFVMTLKKEFFFLNSTSVFRELFSSWHMGVRNEASAPIKLKRNYLNIKTKMKISWRKWTNVGISVALLINVILICWVVLLFYFVIVDGSLHEMVLKVMPNATLYYIFSGVCYIICKHIIPLLLYLLRNLGYQNQETKLNFFVGRIFFLLLSFYVILIIALSNEFPVFWPDILKMHLYVHVCVDVLVLFIFTVLFTCLPKRFLLVTNRFTPRFHPLDEFTVHEKLPSFAIDLLLLTLSMMISQSLSFILLAKYLLIYAINSVMASLSRSTALLQNVHSAKNVIFLEKSFCSLSLLISIVFSLRLFLPRAIKNCPQLSRFIKSTLPNDPFSLFQFSYSNLVLVGSFICMILLILRLNIKEYCLKMEGLYLKRHLEDLNQDKYYQVKKQKQWYPNCKCHESRTRPKSKDKTNSSKTRNKSQK